MKPATTQLLTYGALTFFVRYRTADASARAQIARQLSAPELAAIERLRVNLGALPADEPRDLALILAGLRMEDERGWRLLAGILTPEWCSVKKDEIFAALKTYRTGKRSLIPRERERVATVAPFSAAERERLAQCEAVVARGLKTFLEVGTALAEIRDRKLYRLAHSTFEGYLREKWQMARGTGYALMQAAEVVAELKAAGVTALPPSVNAARALAPAPSADRPRVWAEVTAKTDAAQVTADQVRAAVRRVRQPTKGTKARKRALPARTVRFTPREWAALDTLAQARGATIPELLRHLIAGAGGATVHGRRLAGGAHR